MDKLCALLAVLDASRAVGEVFRRVPDELRAGPDASLVPSIRPTEATIAIAHRLGAAPVPAPPKTPKVRCKAITNAPTSPIPHT